MSKSTILIVDDDESLGDVLRDILTAANYDVRWTQSGWQAFKILSSWQADLVLLDLKLPGMDGLSILRQLQRSYPLTQVIMISGHGTISKAVESIRIGAFDWMEKPLDKERVLSIVSKALAKNQLLKEKSYRTEETLKRFGMIGVSPSMQVVFHMIDRVSGNDVTVIIRGESGTGKELVARAIHQNSKRSQRPFVHLNCAAIPETLIESELFGHIKGAFTGALTDQAGRFQAADTGTLFLDEIGDLSSVAQAKVLRAIEMGEVARIGSTRTDRVDVRFISATNKDLSAMIKKNLFREDLYHRIAVIEISLPPLRERKEDILPLAEYYLNFFCSRHNLTAKVLDSNAYPFLLAHDWPGNVRELRNFVEKLIILTDEENITGQQVARLLQFPHLDADPMQGQSFAESKAFFEKTFLQHALEVNNWNILKTSEQIGMERSVLYKKLEKYGLKKSQKEDTQNE